MRDQILDSEATSTADSQVDRFHAGYAGVFRACYSTELSVTSSGAGWSFQGESDIGWLAGGVYRYEGEATTDTFTSRYKSKYDHGEFRLSRKS